MLPRPADNYSSTARLRVFSRAEREPAHAAPPLYLTLAKFHTYELVPVVFIDNLYVENKVRCVVVR